MPLKRSVLFAVVMVCLLAVWLLGPVSRTVAQEYTVGPGDVLRITVWGHEDLSRDYPVSQDGRVPFPLIGGVDALGLTTTQLAKRLHDLLEKDYLVDPQVLVAVKEYLSKKVHVIGEADHPGLFYLTGPTTLFEILSKAGGLSKNAGKDLVLVRAERPVEGGHSAGSTILRFDLRKILAGDVRENVFLENGDMMFVPKAQGIFVLGEVSRAGTYPIDKETTVLEAITVAGGFAGTAAPSGVKVLRRAADGRQETFPLDLAGAVPKDKNFKLFDGDTVIVPKGNTFFVFGEVKKPGAYQLDKETNVLEGITIAGGFTDKAAPGRTRVIRVTEKGQQTLNVDMNDVIRRGQRDKAIRLMENDVIVVPESFF
jgi:polysaccharide export outer membrane protein